jgi:hypothetical protein
MLDQKQVFKLEAETGFHWLRIEPETDFQTGSRNWFSQVKAQNIM